MRLVRYRLLVMLALLAAAVTGCAGVGSRAEVETSTPTASPSPLATEAPTPVATPTATPDWTALPEPGNDAETLGRQLSMVEAAIRDPNVGGAQLSYVGHLQQLVYARLRDYPEWRDTALARLPATTREAVLGALEAARQLRLIPGPVP